MALKALRPKSNWDTSPSSACSTAGCLFLIEYSITLENIWLRFLKVFEQTGTHEDHVSFILIEFLQQVAHRRPIRFIDRKEGLRIKTLLVDLSHRRIEGRKALCPGGERRFTF